MTNNPMKRLLAMALCLCMLLGMYVPSASAATASYHDMSMSQLLALEEDLTWVFTGDSITHNGGWTGGYNDYAAWFEKYLYDIGRGDDTLINTAWGGAAIDHFQPSRSGDDGMGLEQFVTKYNPDVVFIKLGMNNRQMDNASFASRYNAMLDGIYAAGQKNGKKPKIVLLSPTPLSGEFGISSGEFGSDPTTEGYYDSVKRFSETLSLIASQRGLQFVDLRQAMVDESANLGDRFHYTFFSDPSDGLIHPNGAGQYFMFKTICRTLGLYDASMPIFKVSYDDITDAPLYSDDTAVSYTGEYGDVASNLDNLEMNRVMPVLEKNIRPELLASVDFTDQDGTFVGGATYAGATRVDMTNAEVMDDALTLAEAQALGTEFSVIFRAKLNPSNKDNQPVLFISANGTANWSDAVALGAQGKGDQIYYEIRSGGKELTNSSNTMAIDSAKTAVNGGWHTVAYVQTANNLQYYVDGTLVATKDIKLNSGSTVGAVFANAKTFAAHIGSYGENAGTYQLDGKLDYYQLYKGALDAADVAYLTASGGKLDETQMNKTMPTVSDASPLAAVDFSSATGTFAGTDAYATSTRVDLTDASVVNDALTLEEVQAMGREFSIVLRARLDSTTYRPHQALLMLTPGDDAGWSNAISVGGPGTGHNLYYEVRQNGAERTNSSNTIALASATPNVRDAWHTIAIVQRTDGLDYYVDGALAESKPYKLNDGLTFGGLFTDATEFTAQVGSFTKADAPTYNLKAKLDYYQFYGTALSAAQVQSLGSGAVSDADQMNATMPQLPVGEYVPNLLASVDFTDENGKLDFGSSAGLRIDTATEGYNINTLTQAEAATLGDDFSLVFRAKLDNVYQTNQPALYISSNGTDNWQNALVLGVPGKVANAATPNQLYYGMMSNSQNTIQKAGQINFGGNAVADGQTWHTVAITVDNGTVIFYVDGAQIGQATGYGLKDGYTSIGSLFENSTDFAVQIGRYGTVKDGTSYKLKGNFDFWQFYDGVLSASQIQKLSTAAEGATVTPAVWTDTVKANSVWAVVGADQMSGYLGETPNFSLFRLLNNGMRGGANELGSFRDIRMMNLAKPGQTVGQVVANYEDVLGEHRSVYNVLMLLPELPEVHAAGYTHSEEKVAAYKANIRTLIEQNRDKAIVLWTPLASPGATVNGYITDYADAVREIVGEDPTVLLFDANEFMNERLASNATLSYSWFEDSMNITPLCATDLVYAFYVHANYPTYGSGKDPTNKGEILSHNLRLGSDKRAYKSGVIKENAPYGVSVNGGTLTVDASNLAAAGFTNLRVAVIPGIGAGSVVEPWILGSVGTALAAPYSNPAITVYGELGGRTFRFKDVQLELSTGNNMTGPYTKTSGLTGLEVVGAPAIGFSPDKTTYNVELYQYQRQVRIVAEGGDNLTIQVNGKTVKPGNFSQYIAVNNKATVTVTVTGGDADKTYTLNLTRPNYADIIVTEVMTDGYANYTRSGADNYELIEIYNASGKDLNLLDYSIGYIREYPYANDKIENGKIPYYFTGNDHNFFGNTYLGINQITKYSSYWADKVDLEPAEVIFPANSTMVIWVKFSKDAGKDYGAALTYETLISALEAHAGTHTLTVDVEVGDQTITKTVVPTLEQLVVAEIPYGAAQSNVTQSIKTSATNFYMDGFQKQIGYNNRRGWLFVLDDSAVRDYYGALTEAGDDIVSAAKYVRAGDTNKLSNVMYYDVTRGMSVVRNAGYWDENFSTGHTSDQQGYANMTSFGAIEYWQKPYNFGDTIPAVISNTTPGGALRGDDAAIRLDITDNQDVRYLELYVDADDDGTYETVLRKDITLITSAYNAGKVSDVKSYAFTHTLTDLQNNVKYYGFVLDSNSNKTLLGSAEEPMIIRLIEPGQLKVDATVVNEAGEASAAELEVSITLSKGAAQEEIGADYVVYNSENQTVGQLTDGKGTVKVGNGDSLIVKGLPDGADYTLKVTVPEGYRDLTPAENLNGRIGTLTATTAVASQKILITGDLTVTADIKQVNGESAGAAASMVITLSKGTSPVELAESYQVEDAQGNKLGETAGNTVTVSLTDGQKAVVKDLPVGADYTVTVTAPDGYRTLTDSVSGSLADANGETEILSVKEILITGNLTVNASVKRVNDTASEETVAVKITLTKGDAKLEPTADYRVVNAADEVLGLIRNGEGTVTLGNGEKAIIQGLPAGTAYTLTLASIPEDYEDVTATALTGNVSAEGSAATVAVKEKLVTGALTVSTQLRKVDDTVSDQKISVTIRLEKGDSLVALAESYTVVDGSGNVLGETLWGSVTVELGDGEKAVIAGLPKGAKYTVTSVVPQGYEDITADETTGNVVKAGSAVNVCAKEQLITGSLTVTAAVETIYGAYSQEKIDVKIHLTRGNAPVDPEAGYDIVDAYGNLLGTVVNGEGMIQLGNDQKAIINNVAEGTAYTVTVMPSSAYKNTTTGETAGNVVRSGSTVALSAKEKLPSGTLTVEMVITDNSGAAADSSVQAAVKISVTKGDASVDLDASYDILNSEGTKIGTLTDGEAVVELPNGGIARIDDLPAGAAYTVTLTVPENYEDLTTGETGGKVAVEGNAVTLTLKKQRTEASFNGKEYRKLSEALEAAKDIGGTVLLIADAETGDVMIQPGITLDLNGHSLRADFAAVFNGAHLIDGSEANTGKLYVAAENVIIAADNAQLPVWNGEAYLFSKVNLSRAQLDGAVTPDGFGYAFQPRFAAEVGELLKNGGEDNGVTVEVRISWNTENYREYRNLVYNDQQIGSVISSYLATGKGALTLSVSGFSKIKGISEITVEAVVRSNTGAYRVSRGIIVVLPET